MAQENVLNQLQKAVIYEMNTRQFSEAGDFKSVQQHLPRLSRMGITILWFMPIHPIGKVNRKGSLGSYYSSSDFFGINPEYGEAWDFKNLVQEAHALGMRVILDWVANHAAWDNNWTHSHPHFFERGEQGDFLSPFDWSDVIQINHAEPEAHEAIQEAMLYWIREFDIDGFRADLAHLTPLQFWKNVRDAAQRIKPDLIWLAETEEPHYYEAFDIVYAWKWMHETAAVVKGQLPVSSLKQLLENNARENAGHAFKLYFTSNHDENSWNGTEQEKYGAYAQALAIFNFTWPYAVPLIYTGQEIPNTRRLAFFEQDPLLWSATPALAPFFQTLSELRRAFDFDHEPIWMEAGEQILAFTRKGKKQTLHVFLHLGTTVADLPLGELLPEGTWQDVFNGNEVDVHRETVIQLEPASWLLLRLP